MNTGNFVVLVNFHSEDQTVTSLKRLAGLKIVVVDNGSTDENWKKIVQFIAKNSAIFTLRNKTNLGFAQAVNKGVELAVSKQAERIFLVNPDVSVTPEQIKKLSTSGFDIVSPVLKSKRKGKVFFDLGGKINFVLGRTSHRESSTGNILRHECDYVSGACMGIKTEVFKKTGLLDPQFFMYFEDVDFCLRARRAGLSIGVEGSVLVEHELETHKLSGNKKKMRFAWRSNWVFIQKWVPWYFKPLAIIYLLWLWSKIS